MPRSVRYGLRPKLVKTEKNFSPGFLGALRTETENGSGLIL